MRGRIGAALLIALAGNPAGVADPIEGSYLTDKARYLCTWRQSHPENPIPLPSCDRPATGSMAEQDEMQAWWQWMFNTYTNKTEAIRASFLDDWSRDRKPTFDRQRRAAVQKAAEKKKLDQAKVEQDGKARHDAYIASIPLMNNGELCDAAHWGEAKAQEELKRRKVLSEAEWAFMSTGKVEIGMSELALLCSRGSAPVNRTVTAAGVKKQYVYDDGTYVYVDNGKVIALQDRR